MSAIPIKVNIFGVVGINCCISDRPATPVSMHDIEYTTATYNAVTLKQSTQTAQLSSTISPSFPGSAKNLETTESSDGKYGDDNKNFSQSCNSTTTCVSTMKATRWTAKAYSGQGQGQKLFTMPSLLDEKEGEFADIDISCQNTDGTGTTCSESRHSTSSLENNIIALEVGISAHEYLEECFYTEASVLDRGKLNAVIDVVKSDFTITDHLGTGSFSDVFEVVCNDGHSFGSNMNAISGSKKLDRKHSFGGKVSTPLSNSTTPTTVDRIPLGERKLVFAMKCLRHEIQSDADRFTVGAKDLVHETAILANLNHRHIIKLHGRAHGNLVDAFTLNDGYFILLDRLDETLDERIGVWKHSPMCTLGPPVEQIEVAHSIADAVAYLHSKTIAFRDLKPANVGFDSMGVLKLFDFGFAIGLPEKDEVDPDGFLFDRCGTTRYMAPEIGLSLGYGLKADVYSFGILLWEVCALDKPYSSITSTDEFERSVFIGGKRPVVDNRWPTALKGLIRSCWSATPRERPTMFDVKSFLSTLTTKKTFIR